MQFHVGAACYTLLEICVTTCLKMLDILHLPCKINTTKPLNYTQGLYHFIKKRPKLSQNVQSTLIFGGVARDKQFATALRPLLENDQPW